MSVTTKTKTLRDTAETTLLQVCENMQDADMGHGFTFTLKAIEGMVLGDSRGAISFTLPVVIKFKGDIAFKCWAKGKSNSSTTWDGIKSMITKSVIDSTSNIRSLNRLFPFAKDVDTAMEFHNAFTKITTHHAKKKAGLRLDDLGFIVGSMLYNTISRDDLRRLKDKFPIEYEDVEGVVFSQIPPCSDDKIAFVVDGEGYKRGPQLHGIFRRTHYAKELAKYALKS